MFELHILIHYIHLSHQQATDNGISLSWMGFGVQGVRRQFGFVSIETWNWKFIWQIRTIAKCLGGPKSPRFCLCWIWRSPRCWGCGPWLGWSVSYHRLIIWFIDWRAGFAYLWIFFSFFGFYRRCCGTRIRVEMSSGRSRRYLLLLKFLKFFYSLPDYLPSWEEIGQTLGRIFVRNIKICGVFCQYSSNTSPNSHPCHVPIVCPIYDRFFFNYKISFFSFWAKKSYFHCQWPSLTAKLWKNHGQNGFCRQHNENFVISRFPR